ncbi:hypothetical protein ACFVTX_11735 [Agromyces sp. NPDC058136]|uniref:hypothetical protein n=1 Tax=Agromyces sp. NPDC058136 TaxID=3346354 RepID=UPI0036DEEA39
MTTATATTGTAITERSARSRPGDIWRIIRLQAVNPSMLFGIPWMILGGALVVTILIALILRGAGISDAEDGFRYSWAVLSPQWYLIAVGVQAVAFTFSFALGFGATRRDYWIGTSAMFLFVSFEMAVAIATLVQVEKATNGWWIGAGMFDTLWYGQQGWWFDFYSTFALQLLVLFIGASITTIYMRWRMRGMITLLAVGIAALLALVAGLTFSDSWGAVFEWVASIGLVGVFTILLVKAVFWAVLGYFVIRRATPR